MYVGDWSSDVCSSAVASENSRPTPAATSAGRYWTATSCVVVPAVSSCARGGWGRPAVLAGGRSCGGSLGRSEERRVRGEWGWERARERGKQNEKTWTD